MHLKQILTLGLFIAATPALLVAQQEEAVEAEVVIALSVEDRQPVGAANNFPEDVGQVTAWTRVTGAANTTIEHVWRYREHERVIHLSIGGSPWRTWSTKNIPPEWDGDWTFEVRDADGRVVATATFTIGGSQ